MKPHTAPTEPEHRVDKKVGHWKSSLAPAGRQVCRMFCCTCVAIAHFANRGNRISKSRSGHSRKSTSTK